MFKRSCHITFLLLILLFLAALAHANDTISGKVVDISDGDTITVLENRTQYKIRLFGIDTPERHQDFANKAKTDDLKFGVWETG